MTVAEQADHVVHGALVDQVPEVQPGQSEAGHWFPFHHFVQAPLVQAPDCPKGPLPQFPPENGPPDWGPHPPDPPPNPNPAPPKPPGPPDPYLVDHPDGVAVPHGPAEMPLAAVKEDQSPLEGPLGCAEVYEAKAAEPVKLPPPKLLKPVDNPLKEPEAEPQALWMYE